jgi:hypothetical protein
MTGATCCEAVTDDTVWKVSGPDVLERTGRGGKGALDVEAPGAFDE